MGIRGSVYSIYKVNPKTGLNEVVKTVYAGPTQSQKERGFTPKVTKPVKVTITADEVIIKKPSTTKSREAKKKKTKSKARPRKQ